MVNPQVLLIAVAAAALWYGGREAYIGVKKAGQAIVHVFHHHPKAKGTHATPTRGNQPAE